MREELKKLLREIKAKIRSRKLVNIKPRERKKIEISVSEAIEFLKGLVMAAKKYNCRIRLTDRCLPKAMLLVDSEGIFFNDGFNYGVNFQLDLEKIDPQYLKHQIDATLVANELKSFIREAIQKSKRTGIEIAVELK